MSKAILVMDMPDSCDDCHMCYYSDGRVKLCYWHDKVIDADKPDWCPLKEMPVKVIVPQYQGNGIFGINTMAEARFKQGWNACIDNILGE